MARVMLLLFKHMLDPDLQEKLPGILSLMKTLMEKETGLQYFETVLRYLFSTMDNISTEKMADAVMAEVKKINDIDMLIKIKDAIKTAKDSSEILLLI